MGHLLGYARVSTADQNPELQLDALKAAGCTRVYTDHASGRLDQRPELDKLMERLDAGDVLVVWKLDRLGRSLKHLVGWFEDLERRGVEFRSLTEQIDTTTAQGRFFFHVTAAFAQLSVDLTRERTVAGLAAARARGRVGGRPALMTEDKIKLARSMYESGEYTIAAIAKVLGVSRSTVYAHLGGRDQRTSTELATSRAGEV